MKIYDKLMNYMKLCENVRKSRTYYKIYENLGNTKEICEIVWKCKKNYENVRNHRKT